VTKLRASKSACTRSPLLAGVNQLLPSDRPKPRRAARNRWPRSWPTETAGGRGTRSTSSLWPHSFFVCCRTQVLCACRRLIDQPTCSWCEEATDRRAATNQPTHPPTNRPIDDMASACETRARSNRSCPSLTAWHLPGVRVQLGVALFVLAVSLQAGTSDGNLTTGTGSSGSGSGSGSGVTPSVPPSESTTVTASVPSTQQTTTTTTTASRPLSRGSTTRTTTTTVVFQFTEPHMAIDHDPTFSSRVLAAAVIIPLVIGVGVAVMLHFRSKLSAMCATFCKWLQPSDYKTVETGASLALSSPRSSASPPLEPAPSTPSTSWHEERSATPQGNAGGGSAFNLTR
jgi:hypothetical protein